MSEVKTETTKRFSIHRIGKLLRSMRLLGVHWSPADRDRRWETVNRLRIGLWFTVVEITWWPKEEKS